MRCFPQTTASTVAFLHMLARWAILPAAKGGFKLGSPKDISTQLFSALVHLACAHNGGHEFKISLDPDWVCQWPRPAVSFDDATVSAKWSGDGLLDLSAFYELDHNMIRHSPLSRCHQCLKKVGFTSLRQQMLVVEFLQRCLPEKVLGSLVAQVLTHLAWQLERALGHMCNPGSGGDGSAASFVYTSWAPSPDDRNLDQKLYAYVMAGEAETRKFKVMSVCTDKASPTFQSLQNYVISLPNGVVIVCCPQVVRDSLH